MSTIRVDEQIAIEVYFNLDDREEGYEDDIRFRIKESGAPHSRISVTGETSSLLTADQAQDLTAALGIAARESKETRGK